MLNQEELGDNHIPTLIFDRSGMGTRELVSLTFNAWEDHGAVPSKRYAKVHAVPKAKGMPIFHQPCDKDLMEQCHCKQQKFSCKVEQKLCFKRA